jgi:hypothetical protein
MKKIEDLRIGEVVYVKSRDEKGTVVEIHPRTITVRFMTGVLDVHEGDFEERL